MEENKFFLKMFDFSPIGRSLTTLASLSGYGLIPIRISMYMQMYVDMDMFRCIYMCMYVYMYACMSIVFIHGETLLVQHLDVGMCECMYM